MFLMRSPFCCLLSAKVGLTPGSCGVFFVPPAERI
jgi:hypothetical protein